MAEDWNIKPRGEVCGSCQTPFSDGQPCHTALSYGENGYQRADYCETCWLNGKRGAEYFSAWKGVFNMPEQEDKEALEHETAESLLRKLIKQDASANRNTIYILAVMLERKRMFVERDVRRTETGVTIRLFEHKGTGETFSIVDPNLMLDQIGEVQQEVARMLGWGEPAPSAQQPEECSISE